MHRSRATACRGSETASLQGGRPGGGRRRGGGQVGEVGVRRREGGQAGRDGGREGELGVRKQDGRGAGPGSSRAGQRQRSPHELQIARRAQQSRSHPGPHPPAQCPPASWRISSHICLLTPPGWRSRSRYLRSSEWREAQEVPARARGPSQGSNPKQPVWRTASQPRLPRSYTMRKIKVGAACTACLHCRPETPVLPWLPGLHLPRGSRRT